MTLAVLAMYPFAHLSDAYDELWAAIAARVDDAPERLDRDVEVHASWLRDDLLLGQTCGWPLVTRLADRVAVIGAFDHAVGFAADGTYRSVLVASRAVAVDQWRADPQYMVAVNDLESLSGWVSMCWAWGGPPPNCLVTGSHVESMRAVAQGRANIASIDAVTYEFEAEAEPETVSHLQVVGHGPVVPSLPLVTSIEHAHRVAELRDAVRGAVADPAAAAALARLRIRGFVPLDLSDYEPLRSMDHLLHD